MTSAMTIPALAVGSIISALLLVVTHEVMRAEAYRNVQWPPRYSIGIICGMVGALVYGALTGDWLLLIGTGVLFLPGGALVMALYGKHGLDAAAARKRMQADFARHELLREEHDDAHE